MDQGARFPAVKRRRGHYESFYIKACRPGGGRGVWIRHTVHKRPGAEPKGSIWFTFFDAEADGPHATKITVGPEQLSVPTGEWIRVQDAEIGPGHARGAISTDALNASWEMNFSGKAGPCAYLPAEWLYKSPLPKTKFVAPHPDVTFEGSLTIDGETIALDGWPGMIGHNWGTEHAERWVWLEGTGFPDRDDTYFDAGAARIQVGRWTSPWIPSGKLRLEGTEHRLGGPKYARRAKISERPTSCEFELPGDGVIVRGRVSAPQKDFVGWVYADPAGPEHNTVNCSISDLELEVLREGRPADRLELKAGAAYEFGMRETDHGIPVQPYPDG